MIKNKKLAPNIKKKIVCSVLLAVSIFGSYRLGKEVGMNTPLTSKYYPSHKVIATVNGKDIYSDSFKANMNILFHMNKDKKYTKEELKTEESQYLDYLTLNSAIYEIATKEGITIDEQSVSESYSTIIDKLSESFNMTEEKILKKFKLDKNEVLENLKIDHIVTKYIEEKCQVSDEEILEYYNDNKEQFIQYKASHILISTKDSSGNELLESEKELAKKEALSILNKVNNGENFEELAKKYSEDSSSSNGGDLGYFGKGDMVENFQKAIEKIEVGELYSDIVETPYGYHIIKKTDELKKPFEDCKEEILTSLSYIKQTDLIQKIREESDITILYNN